MGSRHSASEPTATHEHVHRDGLRSSTPARETTFGVPHVEDGVEHSDLSTLTAANQSAVGIRVAAPALGVEHVHAEELNHEKGAWSDGWGVVRYKHYRNILSAQFISNIGTWTEMFAIQMYIAQRTGRLDDQGMLGVCQQLPIFLFGIFGGLMADRVNRRTLLVVSQLLAGVVAAGVALVVTLDSSFENSRAPIYWLFALGAINGVVMAFNFPAWQVLTPRLVPKAKLTQAIVVNGIQFNLARVLGPALGGWVLAQLGGPPLLWFNTATFFLMAGVVMTTPDAPARIRTSAVAAIVHGRFKAWRARFKHWLAGMLEEIREAVRFLTHNRGPRAVFIAQVMLSLLAAPLVRLLSNFVIDVYGLKGPAAEHAGGWLLATQGLGAVAGGVALRAVPRWYPKHHFIPMAVTGLGVTISVFALTTTLWAGYLAMAACGWFWIWAFNQSWAAVQVLTPDKIRGRALSLVTVMVFGATALGVFVAGLLGEKAKVFGWLSAQHATQGSILLLSLPLVVAGVWMMTHRVPEVDGLQGAPKGTRGKRSLINAVTAREHRPREEAEPPEGVV